MSSYIDTQAYDAVILECSVFGEEYKDYCRWEDDRDKAEEDEDDDGR